MDLTLVVLVVALPVVVLIAWGMWLIFAALIAKWHGPAGLAAVRHVADSFRPREWALLIPRQVLSSALAALATARGGAPAAGPVAGGGAPPDNGAPLPVAPPAPEQPALPQAELPPPAP